MENISYIRTTEKSSVEYKTIYQSLKELAQSKPTQEMIVLYSDDGTRESITFSEVYKNSEHFAGILSAMGVHKGDRVIIRMYNSMEWLTIVFGLMAVGAVPVTSYIVKKDVSDLLQVLQKTDAVGLFFSEEDPDIICKIKDIVQNCFDKLKFAVSLDIMENDSPLLSYHELLKSARQDILCNDVTLDPDDEINIMRTSGSTGQPKLVSHSHYTFRNGSRGHVDSHVKRLCNLDFSYWDASPIIEIIIEGTQVSVRGNPSLVSVEKLLRYAEIESCTFIELSQLSMNLLVKENFKIPPCVKTVVLGGSPIKSNFQSLLENVECLLCGYGSLEAGDVSMIKIVRGMMLEDNIGGYPLPDYEIKVVDDKNSVVQRGAIGRILARNAHMFLGYVDDEEETRKAVSPSGWYNTGDLGYICRSGKLFVIGRGTDCVARDTETICVSEIVQAIEDIKIDCIQDVAVVPIPDELFNEEVCACIIRKSKYTTAEEEILQIFNNAINSPYYRPRYVVFVDTFPRTASGKINKIQLRDTAIKVISEQKKI